ncbi:murein hydrolase activator EnvC [Novosphingobium colocasiae]|uniref:murein hydrolase activator EnvC family protein n=1 Tax=Novosphingobium colocasiae TaxID=1256513 RepID=UPI0035B48C91
MTVLRALLPAAPRRRAALLLGVPGLAIGMMLSGGWPRAQGVDPALLATNAALDARQAGADLRAAQAEGSVARKRAERLEANARAVTAQAEKTAREAAAVAARIQETQAAIAAQQARTRGIAAERAGLRARMAARQAPLARLTGSLQRLSRRPPLLALLRPGSVSDVVYLRALLDTMLPQVEARTAALRSEIEKGRALERKAQAAEADLRKVQGELTARRQQLAVIESRQRLAGREASGLAAREAEHALALAEKARDLGGLLDDIGRQGALRDALAGLPGPVMRPPDPARAQVIEAEDFAPPPEGLPGYMLPVVGRVLSGFGESAAGQARSAGLTLVTRPLAQAVAPAPGRVAFAGPYGGYGRIVIIEHDGGWTSLVTGLARLDVRVGDTIVAGSPLGMAGPGAPRVGVELRRNGQPVNPLQYLQAL